jgi:hypothetical protein
LLQSFKQKVENVIQIRLNILEQRILPQKGSTFDSEFNFEQQMDALKKQLNNSIQTRMNILEQRCMQHVPTPSSSDFPAHIDTLQRQLNNTIQVRMTLLEQRMVQASNKKDQVLSSSSSAPADLSASIDVDKKLDSFKMQVVSLIQAHLNLLEQRMVHLPNARGNSTTGSSI